MAAYLVVVKTARGEEALSTSKSVSFRARREGFARRRMDTARFARFASASDEGRTNIFSSVLHVDLHVEYYVVPT